MKMMKFNYALAIAVLVIGITVTTKANNRSITRCFINVTVTNGSIITNLNTDLTCTQADLLFAAGYSHITAASVASSLPSEQFCPVDLVMYCCVKVVEAPTDPYSTPLDLGEGVKKYRVQAIFCRPESFLN